SSCGDVITYTMNGLLPTGSSLTVGRVGAGMLYVGAGDSLLAFDAGPCPSSPCTPVWTAATGGTVFSTPAVANGVVYVGSEDQNLYAFDAATGAPLWSGATGGVIDASPAVGRGLVFIGSFDGGVYAFDANGCGSSVCPAVWGYATGGPVFASPTLA